jgi:pimeloyl-ACP methyl ester carboxylesterase
MLDSSVLNVLAVPNLQGERFFWEIENSQIDWVEGEDSLQHQVETLKRTYNGQQVLIGSSFGGLAAWMFAAEQCTPHLNGLILIDVLPDLASFPNHRALAFTVLSKLPQRLSQYIYNQYRSRQGETSVQMRDVLLRVRSIQKRFPSPYFPVPTLVVSTNKHFHQQWKQMSQEHDLLSVQEKTNLSVQINAWVKGLDQGGRSAF